VHAVVEMLAAETVVARADLREKTG